MKQVLQNVKNGNLSLKDCPAPMVQAGQVLVANEASLISAGTEKMVMDLASKSLLGKAKERPDHVKRVLEKVKNEGLLNTVRAVREKLDEPMAMGYSSAGIVLACGQGVQQFKAGDRVASNGGHAEVVSVSQNLCARVPEGVSGAEASFAILGAIALQGVRLAKIHLGETVFVVGLGLVGQLTVSLLAASGCRVIGTDPDVTKCDLALKMGASIAEPNISGGRVEGLTHGMGADAVVITASTKSNGPIETAAAAIRKKGRVVLVGVVGLELDRRPFYFKEAEFVVSCSYGPGRYDARYEDLGQDYPFPYVRWTQQRNIAAILGLMANGRLDVVPLISHRFDIENALDAYNMIREGREPYLGVVLQYNATSNCDPSREVRFRGRSQDRKPGVGVLGAGNFARMVLIPKIVAHEGIIPRALCSGAGVSASHVGEKHGFEKATSDEGEILNDSDIAVVFSITQHHLHAKHVLEALKAGKNIFVEKPLCLSVEELSEIDRALMELHDQAPMVMVGFNRRFAPIAQQLKSCFDGVDTPLAVQFRFNAGDIPDEHWTQIDELGGGRIIGEACHAIDFSTWLTGSLPVRVFAESVGGGSGAAVTDDQCFITIRHANGSISSISYLASGDRACPKERIEVFGGGRTAILDDFKTLTTFVKGRKTISKVAQDKGHDAEINAFLNAIVEGTDAPIPWSQTRATSLAAILAVRSLREGVPMDL